METRTPSQDHAFGRANEAFRKASEKLLPIATAKIQLEEHGHHQPVMQTAIAINPLWITAIIALIKELLPLLEKVPLDRTNQPKTGIWWVLRNAKSILLFISEALRLLVFTTGRAGVTMATSEILVDDSEGSATATLKPTQY